MTQTSKIYTGQISHLLEGKGYGVIEYVDNKETKSILFLKDVKNQRILKKQKLLSEVHKFRNGDIVEFKIKQSDKDNSKDIAYDVVYKSNDAINTLLIKAEIENKFLGYLKIIEERFYVKEVETYLFIPVDFSKWELLPEEDLINTMISFKLINTNKINKLSAKLLDSKHHQDFQIIKDYWTKEIGLTARISKLNPASISLDLFNGQFKGKLTYDQVSSDEEFLVGQLIEVKITNIDNDTIGVSRL